MKTYSAKLSDIENEWFVIDAKDLVLGRLAAVVATRLKGKHKVTYTPHMDCGDNIIVINAEKVATTGGKLDKEKFYWHTGFPGGIKSRTWGEIINGKYPERLVSKAVERMLAKGPLARKQMRRLYVYKGESHPHAAQSPKVLDVASMNKKNKRG